MVSVLTFLWRSEFESRWSLQFRKLFENNENKQKEGGGREPNQPTQKAGDMTKIKCFLLRLWWSSSGQRDRLLLWQIKVRIYSFYSVYCLKRTKRGWGWHIFKCFVLTGVRISSKIDLPLVLYLLCSKPIRICFIIIYWEVTRDHLRQLILFYYAFDPLKEHWSGTFTFAVQSLIYLIIQSPNLWCFMSVEHR